MKNFCSYIVLVCVWWLSQLSEAHYTQQWVVHVAGGRDVADAVARDHGFINLGEIFDEYYHFSHHAVAKRSISPHRGKRAMLAADTRVRWSEQQIAKRRVKRDLRLQDSDPRWPNMWYLNRGNGLDMNVIPAWLEGVTGKGAVVTILDDGLEKDHPDLVQNYDPMASYDVNNEDSDPSPRYDMIDSNRHGTRCAGEVAATSNNSVCALGVAHGAQVGGVRMLDGEVTDAVEARSLSLNPQHIDIYSASWGPDDDGKTVDGPGELATRAFHEGVTKGRNGKGSIFVWASGNGGREHDNCNCDGYTNSIYSLSISSATEQGHVPWYSEACSSTLASTYSSGAVGEKQVVTTDLHHSCTSSHTGTSASAPLAAGICALALEANPNLTWRDMQHIVVRTARPQHLIAPDWQTNGVGRNVSHSFGYGLMDAYAMVQLARKWITVPEQHKCEITAPHVEKTIPAKSVVVLQLKVTSCPGIEILEHVQAKLTIFSHRRGDLNIQLTSPMGTRVTLLAHRVHDVSRSGFSNWPFMSVHSWGESPYGTWQLEIHNDGRLLASIAGWDLILYGTSTPPAIDLENKNDVFHSSSSSNDFHHNSIDTDSPTGSWDSGAEIRKDMTTVEEQLPQMTAISGCNKTNGRLCIGLLFALIFFYLYSNNSDITISLLLMPLVVVFIFAFKLLQNICSCLFSTAKIFLKSLRDAKDFSISKKIFHANFEQPSDKNSDNNILHPNKNTPFVNYEANSHFSETKFCINTKHLNFSGKHICSNDIKLKNINKSKNEYFNTGYLHRIDNDKNLVYGIKNRCKNGNDIYLDKDLNHNDKKLHYNNINLNHNDKNLIGNKNNSIGYENNLGGLNETRTPSDKNLMCYNCKQVFSKRDIFLYPKHKDLNGVKFCSKFNILKFDFFKQVLSKLTGNLLSLSVRLCDTFICSMYYKHIMAEMLPNHINLYNVSYLYIL